MSGPLLGGPEVFVEEADNIWRIYLLPEGKRIEDGDKITLSECTPLVGEFRSVSCPRLSDFESNEAYEKAVAQWRVTLERKDLRLTFANGRFVTLIPIPVPAGGMANPLSLAKAGADRRLRAEFDRRWAEFTKCDRCGARGASLDVLHVTHECGGVFQRAGYTRMPP